jgi:hypothetical protein
MKSLKLTDEMLEEAKREFAEKLETAKTIYDLKNFKITVKEQAAKDAVAPTILYTPEAWLKMWQLVDSCSVEVQWHALAQRLIGVPNTFYITDILMYPQHVSAAHCDTDDKKYSEWQREKITNPGFPIQLLRMHGHSHATSGVYSSGVDDRYQMDMMTNIKDFYIFAIANHKHELMHLIYDIDQNTLYERSDIVAGVTFDGKTIATNWGKDMKEKFVEERKITTEYMPQYKTDPKPEPAKETKKEVKKAEEKADKKAWDFWDNLPDIKDILSGQIHVKEMVKDGPK